MKKLTNKQKKIVCLALASWGIILIGSGASMTLMEKPVKKSEVKLKVIQKRVAQTKSNEIKLKDIELEINEPLSVNIKDYLENANNIEEKIIKTLKLDTSMVNIAQAGTYTYTITYKKKKFNGTLTIKEKPLPEITNMTLKTLNLEIGSTLSTDIQTYITETLTDEVKANIKLDLSNVNTSQSGNYQYTVTYNGKLYSGTITIYQPQIINNTTPTPSASPETPEESPQETPGTSNTEE